MKFSWSLCTWPVVQVPLPSLSDWNYWAMALKRFLFPSSHTNILFFQIVVLTGCISPVLRSWRVCCWKPRKAQRACRKPSEFRLDIIAPSRRSSEPSLRASGSLWMTAAPSGTSRGQLQRGLQRPWQPRRTPTSAADRPSLSSSPSRLRWAGWARAWTAFRGSCRQSGSCWKANRSKSGLAGCSQGSRRSLTHCWDACRTARGLWEDNLGPTPSTTPCFPTLLPRSPSVLCTCCWEEAASSQSTFKSLTCTETVTNEREMSR